MQRTYSYEYMYPNEFIQYVNENPVFFVPCGLLEWHGDHLPLGLDALKAHGICKRVAQYLGYGIVLPPNYIGRPGYSSYVGTLTYTEHCFDQLLSELFIQLKKVGAKTIVLLTGHYGDLQVNCIKRVSLYFMQENPEIKIIAGPEYEDIMIDGIIPADHAKLWETSIMMAIDSSVVKIDEFKNGYQDIYTYSDVPNNYYHELPHWSPTINLPELASKELGERVIIEVSKRIKNLLETKEDS